MKRLPVLVTFIFFLALCASATYWTLQFMKPLQRPMAAVIQPTRTELPLEVAAGLFGGRAAKVALASNFQLKGVVVASNAGESVAILGADGKPPQASRVNAEVMPGVTVKEVHGQYVLLSEGGVIKRVELQEPPKTSMQFQSAVPQSLGQLGQQGQLGQYTQPQGMQMAPAMPTTMVVAPGQPPVQIEPPPNPAMQPVGPSGMPALPGRPN